MVLTCPNNSGDEVVLNRDALQDSVREKSQLGMVEALIGTLVSRIFLERQSLDVTRIEDIEDRL